MLQMLRSTMQPVHNGILYMLWLTRLVCACSQDMMYVTFSELVMHSYHIMQDVLLMAVIHFCCLKVVIYMV